MDWCSLCGAKYIIVTSVSYMCWECPRALLQGGTTGCCTCRYRASRLVSQTSGVHGAARHASCPHAHLHSWKRIRMGTMSMDTPLIPTPVLGTEEAARPPTSTPALHDTHTLTHAARVLRAHWHDIAAQSNALSDVVRSNMNTIRALERDPAQPLVLFDLREKVTADRATAANRLRHEIAVLRWLKVLKSAIAARAAADPHTMGADDRATSAVPSEPSAAASTGADASPPPPDTATLESTIAYVTSFAATELEALRAQHKDAQRRTSTHLEELRLLEACVRDRERVGDPDLHSWLAREHQELNTCRTLQQQELRLWTRIHELEQAQDAHTIATDKDAARTPSGGAACTS